MLELTKNISAEEVNLLTDVFTDRDCFHTKARWESQEKFDYVKKIALVNGEEIYEAKCRDGRTICWRFSRKMSEPTFVPMTILDLALFVLKWNSCNRYGHLDTNKIHNLWKTYIEKYIEKRCKHGETVKVYLPMRGQVRPTLETIAVFHDLSSDDPAKHVYDLATLILWVDANRPSPLSWFFQSNKLDGLGYSSQYAKDLLEDPYFHHIMKQYLRFSVTAQNDLHLLPKVKELYKLMAKVSDVPDFILSVLTNRPECVSTEEDFWEEVEKETKIAQLIPK